jgi:hypothetical protein
LLRRITLHSSIFPKSLGIKSGIVISLSPLIFPSHQQ